MQSPRSKFPPIQRRRDHRLWVELFALCNIGGLALDIYIAHSMNFFREKAEYIPLLLSIAAPPVLIVALYCYLRSNLRSWSILGQIVGWACIVVGVAGLLFHLDSSFFQSRTLASLVYSAPFAAPLAYSGLGLLLLMNRMVAPDDADWPRWVLLMALGGFVGNFIFSITDHAQNGFFYSAEWVAVVASAFCVGFLFSPFVATWNRDDVRAGTMVMLAGAAVGVLGFYFHVSANLAATDAPLLPRFIYGAPALAPLLLVDIAVLALIAMAARSAQLRAAATSVRDTRNPDGLSTVKMPGGEKGT